MLDNPKKVFSAYGKYCLTFDANQPRPTHEKPLEEYRFIRPKIRPTFYWLGMQGDAMSFILSQCLLKANPTPDYYIMMFNQLVGLYQDSINRLQKADLLREGGQQVSSDITGNLVDTLKKQMRKVTTNILKATYKTEQVIPRFCPVMKYMPLLETGQFGQAPDATTKDIEKQEQVKSTIVMYERDAYQNLMYEQLLVDMLEANQLCDLDQVSKDMRDEFIKKQYRQTQPNIFYTQISKFKQFMDQMSKKFREAASQRADDACEWVAKFSNQLEQDGGEHGVYYMNQQFICQVIALLNSVFPGRFADLNGIHVPGLAVFTSIFNSIMENEDGVKQVEAKLLDAYTRVYESPRLEQQEMEFDYWVARKIAESYAIFVALYPSLGPEIILKQGNLRRSLGEHLIAEKRDDKTRRPAKAKVNAGDFSHLAPLLLFQIQSYTPTSAAPGANLIFMDKARVQPDQAAMIRDLEMINFDTYKAMVDSLISYQQSMINQLLGQEQCFKMGDTIARSYQSDLQMSQYTLETVMNMLQFSLQNFSENQQLILKLLLLMRDEVQSCTGRKSVYRYRLVHQFYTEYKYYYAALLYI